MTGNDVRILAAAAFVTLAASALVSPASAQTYPERNIRAILPFSPGGLGDTVLRAIGQELSKRLGQPVIVENRPGGNTLIGAQACSAAPPDGHTICMLPAGAMSYGPYLAKKMPFDPDTGMAPITNIFFLTEAFVVNPKLGVNTLMELVALSKAKPNSINYATPASSVVLFMENFKHNTGADLTKIPYKGGGDAVNAVLSGEAPVGYFGVGNMIGHLEAGTVKALAVDGNARSPILPNVPTLAEAGYTATRNRAWFGMFAPGGTPAPIVQRLNAEIAAIVSEPEFKDKFMTRLGLETVLNSPAQFAQFLTEDRARAKLIVERSGLEPE
jgi:tripartite-type tricarboxylate transporter receptor subunit TctC